MQMAFLNVLKNFGTKKADTTPVTTPQTEAYKKIMVIEDEDSLRSLYTEILQLEGFEVRGAENGQVALTLLPQFFPDLILLDLMMPVMNGKEFLRAMSESESLKNIPVIVLTNAGDIDSMNEVKFYPNTKTFLIKASVTPQDIVNNVKTLA